MGGSVGGLGGEDYGGGAGSGREVEGGWGEAVGGGEEGDVEG